MSMVSRAVSREYDWEDIQQDIKIGKDVLELLSTSMYVDPLTVYREYIQNSADAIDEARRDGVLGAQDAGSVRIQIDLQSRNVRIRDNGTGICAKDFVTRLTSVGASRKRGASARGFRGVGRLAGLGYARELVFRTKVLGEKRASEMRWDCRRLRSAIRSDDFVGDLNAIVRECVNVRPIEGETEDHFFEVELLGLTRHRNDRLLDEQAVRSYLAQVAPVPFSPDFRFGAEIQSVLDRDGTKSTLSIFTNENAEPVYRPHRDTIELGKSSDQFVDIETREIPDGEGKVAARIWILHHGYVGAIPNQNLVKGLRVRVGDIQVGDSTLFEDLFPEPRFNAWTVGEINIFDKRIIPNGRRDHFEESVHLQNLLNHLAPLARDIARRCRESSIQRKELRQFELYRDSVKAKLAILRQGSLSKHKAKELIGDGVSEVDRMEKIASSDRLRGDRRKLHAACEALRLKLNKALGSKISAEPLQRLSPQKRAMYENFFGLIYECSTNRIAAKSLVDKMLTKLR